MAPEEEHTITPSAPKTVKYAVPSFAVHCRDCERILGDRHENVNRWLDELFRMKGPTHRRLRHHTRGIQLAQQLFGIEGAKAAIVHVVRDCGHVPDDSDYVSDPCFVDDDAVWVFTNDVSEDVWQQFRRKVHDECDRLLQSNKGSNVI
jgi:hypothetical protein